MITGVARDIHTLRSKFAPPESGVHQSIPDINVKNFHGSLTIVVTCKGSE